MTTSALKYATVPGLSTEAEGNRQWVSVAGSLLIGCLYFWLVFDPGYRMFLFDERLFIQAIERHELAFFPGYIGFLRTAEVLQQVFSPGAALQFQSAFFGSLAVAVFWLWTRRLGLTAPVSIMGTLAFAMSVYQVYNSSVGTTYTAEAFAFLAVGYCCAEAAHKPSFLYLAACVLVLSGAFRQTTPFFLAPLFLYMCWRASNWKPLGVAIAGSLIWLVPTILYFGSIGQTLNAAGAQIDDAVMPSTVVRGAKLAVANTVRFFFYLVYGAPLLFLVRWYRLRLFELLWIGPAFVFYAFFYNAWPGYLLGVLAVVILWGVQSAAQFRQPVALGILALVCLIEGFQVWAVQPIAQPRSTAAAIVSTYGFQYSRAAVQQQYQARLRDVLQGIEKR